MNPVSLTVCATAAFLTGCAATPGSSSGTSTSTKMSATSSAGDASPSNPATTAISMPDGPGRDWTRIDTNGDGYVSPDEMEIWLKANPGPAAKR